MFSCKCVAVLAGREITRYQAFDKVGFDLNIDYPSDACHYSKRFQRLQSVLCGTYSAGASTLLLIYRGLTLATRQSAAIARSGLPRRNQERNKIRVTRRRR